MKDGHETPVAMDEGKEKSERKRQREKQRRSELTNAFDDLSALVMKMDNADEEEGDGDDPHRKKNRRLSHRSEGENETGGMTRVDLINRALAIMKRLHQENADLKQSLSRSGGGGKNEVMVMVPTLTPADDAAPPPAATASSFRLPPYMPPGFAPLPQQDHSQAIYGATQSRGYPPPPQQWGPPYPGSAPANHYGGSERSHRLPPPQMDVHDARSNR